MENLELEIKLTVAQINVILKYLGAGAYAEVADLVTSLHAQARPQLEQANLNQSTANGAIETSQAVQ